MRTGWRAIETIDAPIISTSLGTRSACHGSSARHRAVGDRRRLEVHQAREHLDAGRAVDRRVVHLGDRARRDRARALRRPTSARADGRGRAASPRPRRRTSASSRAPPGAGTATWRTWKSRSKPGSSIQSGWWIPNGTRTTRRRNGGSVSSRLSISCFIVSAVKPPGTSVGSRTATAIRCMWLLGVSSERKAASSPVSAFHASDGNRCERDRAAAHRAQWRDGLAVPRAQRRSAPGSRSTRSGRRRAGSSSASASSPPGSPASWRSGPSSGRPPAPLVFVALGAFDPWPGWLGLAITIVVVGRAARPRLGVAPLRARCSTPRSTDVDRPRPARPSPPRPGWTHVGLPVPDARPAASSGSRTSSTARTASATMLDVYRPRGRRAATGLRRRCCSRSTAARGSSATRASRACR